MRRFQIYSVTLALLGLALLLGWSMRATGGMLIYALDDPYIHLSLAETMLDGGYGVNTGEFASPSSSILYPLILLPLVALGLGTWAPLVVAGLAGAAAVWIVAGLVWQAVAEGRDAAARRFAWLAMPLMLLAINAYALPLTGMEHTLHLLAVALTVSGLTGLGRDGPVPGRLLAGIVLGPLIRFEGLALSLAAIGALLWYRRIGTAVLCGAVLAGALGGYVWAMAAMGLPPLPSSVMVKSSVSSTAVEGGLGGALRAVAVHLREALGNGRALILAMAAVALAMALRPAHRRGRQTAAIVLVALAGLGAHLLVGRYGWFSRYEIYAVLLALLALAWAHGPRIGGAGRLGRLGIALALAAVAWPYAKTTLKTPLAAQGVHDQQYQMHRFATGFMPANVAVNDLGYVSYRNPRYVLDLWGLGSEEARKRHARPDFGADDMRALTGGRDVAYAMIFEDWFAGQVPDEWCRVAVMTTPSIWEEQRRVAVFLIDRAREGGIRDALARFATSLPPRVTLEQAACDG